MLFHTLYGRRVNDALARVYAYAAARLKHRDVEMGISDNGFFIAGEDLNEDKIISLVKAKDLRVVLDEAIEKTEILILDLMYVHHHLLIFLMLFLKIQNNPGQNQCN